MRPLFTCLALATLSANAGAQIKYESATGSVEIFGLRRWTLQMLRDSVRRYVPGLELHDAACMVILRDSLKFADALVSTYSGFDRTNPSRDYRIIKVVEPGDRQRVRWDDRKRNQWWSIRPAYAPLFDTFTDSNGYVGTGRMVFWLQFRDSASLKEAIAHVPESQRADGERILAFLETHKREADLALALRVLERDGFAINRFAAVGVAGNFLDRDSTWYAVVRGLRDPDDRVRTAAAMQLNKWPARQIDWSPVAQDLRLLLGGTNISAVGQVMMLLNATHVQPALARPLLRNNADLVLEHLGSAVEGGAARSLLSQLSGGAQYKTVAEWRAWARRL